MIEFSSLGHVALRVKDIDRSLAFYTKNLGMPEMLRLFYDDGSLFLIYLKITDSQYLELFPEGVGERSPGKDVVAVNHICLTVENLETTIEDLEKAGVPDARTKSGVDGNRQAWIEDPDGTRIELMEMSKDCLQYKALKGLAQGDRAISHKTEAPRPLSFA